MAVIARMNRTIVLGLDENNIRKLKEGLPFHQELVDMLDIPHDIFIVYGKTVEDITGMLAAHIGPDTVVKDHRDRKKN
jgi:hypothetical protein